METDESNTWLTQDPAQVDAYLNSADVVLLERNRTIKILVDLFRYHFGSPNNLSLLDLGCGDGILTAHIRDRFPDNTFCLMDGSAEMVQRAREKLADENVSFVQQTFEDYVDSPGEEQRYDFVYSANAIHHLDFVGKQKLFAQVYDEMRPGGLFVNIDPVQPSSERSEEWQFRMWVDWMNETLLRKGFKGDVGRFDGLPHAYKSRLENKPSGLIEQLNALRKAGFSDVDCFYKYSVFAVFGGTKLRGKFTQVLHKC